MEDVVEAMDGFRDLVMPLGSAKLGRCFGKASGDGPGGEVAEFGGDAMADCWVWWMLLHGDVQKVVHVCW